MTSLILFAALLLLSHPKPSDAAANICTKNHLNPVTNATGCWCSLTTQSTNDSNNCAFGKYCWEEDSTCHDRGLLKIGAILQTSTLEGAVSLAFASFAVEDVNNNSSLLSSYQLEMVVQNSNALSTSAIRSFTSLMDRENVVGIVGSLSYDVLEAVEDMSNMFQLPFIASRVPPPPAEAAEAAALDSKTKKKKKSFVSRMSVTSIQLIETLMTVLDSMDWRKMTVVTTPESEGIYHILKERISTSPNSIELNELKFISGWKFFVDELSLQIYRGALFSTKDGSRRACVNETESSAADTACHLLHSQRTFLLLTDPVSTLQFFSLIKDVQDQAKYAFVVAEVRKEFIFFFFISFFFFVPFCFPLFFLTHDLTIFSLFFSSWNTYFLFSIFLFHLLSSTQTATLFILKTTRILMAFLMVLCPSLLTYRTTCRHRCPV